MTLKIKFKSATLDQFIERYSVDISHGGIFIRTKDPLPVGTALRFEFQLKDATPLIAGDGTVVWTREFDPSRSGVAPGMGVRFDRLPGESQTVLDQILQHKQSKMGGDGSSEDPAAGFTDVPTRVAPAEVAGGKATFGDVPTRVTPAHVLKGLQENGVPDARRTLMGVGPLRGEKAPDDKTPLPRPLPFHSDLDEFPDEAFEEATKVAALEALAKKSADNEGEAGPAFGASMDDDVTVQRTRRPSADDDAGGADADAKGERGESGGEEPSRPQLFAVGSGARPTADEEDGGDPESAGQAESGARERDEEEDESDSGAYTPMQPARSEAAAAAESRAVAARAPAEPERDGGSSLPWIAAAALILVVAGIAGVWYLRDRGEPTADQEEVPAPATETAAGEGPTEAPATAAAATDPAPDQPTGVEAVVRSTPEGATAELVGEDQSGPTPMTFKGLEEGKSYTVRVSRAGFVTREIELVAGKEVPPVELAAKPVVLRVTSQPAGAQIYIDGRRQRGVTPADIPLSARTLKRNQIALSVRKAGYNAAQETVSLEEGLSESDEAMVREVAVTLARRQVATRPTGGGSSSGGGDSSGGGEASGGTSGAGSGGTPSSTGATGDGGGGSSGEEPTGSETPASGEKPAGGETPAGGATPAGGDKPAGDAASTTPTAPAAGAGGSEPKPDWM